MSRRSRDKTVNRAVNTARIELRPVPRLKPLSACIRHACLPAGLLLSLGLSPVLAGPEGGQVVGGQGNISKPDSSTTNIKQNSHNLAIDWQTYNVKKNEVVNYHQPSRNATALNRIYDQNPSQIFGQINANGNVILANPNGMIFGPSAQVNVNSLIGAGHDISVQDFMNGQWQFKTPEGTDAGQVINYGLLEAATGGSISLIGGSVRNEGTILATAGQVNMAAGEQITMDFDGDGLMQFTVDKAVLSNAQDLDGAVVNTGEIAANGGYVTMSGKVAQGVFSHVVNNEGVVRANRIENQGGKIVLGGSGGSQSSVVNTGTLDASAGDTVSDGGSVEIAADTIENKGVIKADSSGGNGGTIKLVAEDTNISSGDAVVSATSISPLPLGEGQGEGDDNSSPPLPLGEGQGEGGQGGTVHVLGDKVALLDNSMIDVSGELGGGEVLIGGDFQGKNPDIQNASMTYVGKDATIKADAITSGDGGKVILWADIWTKFYGDISARGGAEAGDGGFVEVSGKDQLVFRGSADVTASNGQAGTILLDPRDIFIADGTGAADDGQLDADTPDAGDPAGAIFFDDGGGATDFTISETTLEGLTGNIILQAQQDIILQTLTTDGLLNLANQGAGESVVFQAERHITLNSAITTGGGNIHLEADSNGNAGADGVGDLTVNGALTSNGGNITLIGEDFIIGATVNAGAGNISLSEISAPALELGAAAAAEFSQAELNFLTTSGTLFLGQANTAGLDGMVGTIDDVVITVDTLSVDDPIVLDADFTGTVSLLATAGITLTNSFTVDAATTTVNVNADAEKNGAGTFAVNDTFTFNSGGNTLNITAADLNLNASGAITSGAANTSITTSNNRSIGLGATAGDMTISDAELNNITATGLTLTSRSSITVNGITAASTNQISGTTTLDAGTNISFATGASAFTNALTALADNDITASVAVNNGVNTLTFTADDVASGVGAISGAGALTATTIDLDAATGITASTAATTVTADNDTSGDVSVTDADGVTITGSNAGGGSFTAISGGGGTLTVGADNITANTGSVTLQADEVDLTAATSVTGDVGVQLRPNTATTAITLGAGTGGLNFTDASLDKIFTIGTLTIGATTAPAAGAITIDAAIDPANASNLQLLSAGNIIFAQAAGVTALTKAGGTVTLNTTAGAIQGTANVATDISATSVVLTGNQGVGSTNAIETVTSNLTVNNTGAGVANNIQIDNTVSLNLGAGGTVTNAAATGDIDVEVLGAGNDLTISNTVTAGRNVLLTADDDIIFTQAAATTGVSAGTRATLTAGSGSLDGLIVGNANTANDINAANIELVADTGIGNIDEIEINATDATNGLAATTTTGDISIVDTTGGLNIGTVNTTIGLMITTGGVGSDIRVRALSPVTVNDDVINTGGGNIILAAEGVAATDDLTINATVQTTGGTGTIDLYAGDTISFGAAGIAQTASTGQIQLLAGTNYAAGTPVNGNAAGAITMNATSAIRSDDGNIILRAPGDIAISLLNANSNADGTVGDVTVEADYDGVDTGLSNAAGAITEDGDGGADIIGSTVTLLAASGIGSADAIETTATTLTVDNTDSNNVDIFESDDVTLATTFRNQAVGGTLTLTTEDGSIDTDTATVSSNNGTINLIAKDDSADNATPEGITVGTGNIASNGGDINLFAADDIVLTGEVDADTGAVVIEADRTVDDDAADTDGAITGNGLITASDLTLLAGENIGTSGTNIMTDVDNLEAAGAREAAGGIFITEATDLIIGGIGATVGVSTGTADATSDIDISTAQAGGGSITIDEDVDAASGGSIQFQTGYTGAAVNADINLNADITTDGAAVTLLASDSIFFSATGNITSTGASNVQLQANQNSALTGTVGDDGHVINMNAASSIDAGAATLVTLTSIGNQMSDSGDITLGSLTTTNNNSVFNIGTEDAAIIDGNGNTANITGTGTNAELRMTAATGIGTLADGIETEIARIDVTSNRDSGVIHIQEANGVNVISVTQTTDNDANDIIISSTTGDIEIGTISTGGTASDVTLNAVAGAITDAGANSTITADVLTIDAVTGVGDIAGNPINTTVNFLDIDNATSGDIDISETNAVTITKAANASINAGDDVRIVTTTAGDMTVADVSVVGDGTAANSQITLATNDGNILDDNNDATFISAGAAGVNIVITAGGNNDIGATGVAIIPVEYLDISLMNTPAFDFNLTAGQNLFVNFLNGTVTSSQFNGDKAQLEAAGSINIGVTANSFTFDDNTFGDTLVATAFDFNLVADSIVLDTDVATLTNIELDTTGTVVLNAANGSITDNAGDTNNALDIHSGDLTLQANTGVNTIGATGAGSIDTDVDGNLTASTTGGAGGIFISDQNATGLTVTSINANSGDIELDQTVSGISLGALTTTGSVDIDTANTVDFTAVATVGTNLNVDTTVFGTGTGDITDTGGQLLITGTTTLNTANGNSITLDNTTNNFQGNVIVTNTNNLTIDDANAISFGAVTTQNDAFIDAGGTVDFTGVAIIGGDFDIDADINNAAGGDIIDSTGQLLVAGTTTLSAGTGNDIILDEATNDFDDDDSGDNVIVSDTDGGVVTLVDADTLDLASIITDGAISVTANNIDLNGTTYTSNNDAVTFTGAVDLDVGGTTTVTSGNGAGDDITFTSTIDGAAALTLNAGAAGNIDLGGVVGGGGRIGALSITNANNFTADAAIDAASLTQTAGGTTTFSGAVDANAGDIDVTANAIVVDGTLTTSSAGTTGTIQISNNVTVNAALDAGGDDIILNGGATGTLTVSALISDDSPISLTATDDIIVTGTGTVQTTGANDIILTADTGPADGAGGVWVQTGGLIDSGQNIVLNGSDIIIAAATADAGIDIQANGATTAVLDAAGTINLNHNIATANTTNMVINGRLNAGGAVTVTSENAINMGADGDIISAAGGVSLLADTVGTDAGGILMADGALIDVSSGEITLDTDANDTNDSAGGSITIGQLWTKTAATTAVTIDSDGAVLDGGDTDSGAGVTHDIYTQTGNLDLVIDANGGVGTIANALDIAAVDLTVDNTTAGDVHIDKHLFDTDISTLYRNQALNGELRLDLVDGGLSIASAANITANVGDITITTADAGSGVIGVGDGATIDSNGDGAGNGDILLSATTDLVIAGASTVDAGGDTITITANSDGAGTLGDESYSQNAATSVITTTNTTANAITINVNSAAGGAETALLGNMVTGAGGTITVNTANGGNTTGGAITQLVGTLLDTGTGGTVSLTTGNGAIGTTGANILTEADTITASASTGAGNNGIFITEADGASVSAAGANDGDIEITSTTGALDVILATTGTGDIDISTGNGALTIVDDSTGASVVSTSGVGTIDLTATAADLNINDDVTTGTGAVNLTTSTSGNVIMGAANGAITAAGSDVVINSTDNVTLNDVTSDDLTVNVDTNNDTVAALLDLGNGTLTVTNTISLSGGTDNNDTLRGQPGGHTWVITGANAGLIDTSATFASFTNIGTITGDDSVIADTIDQSDGSAVAGPFAAVLTSAGTNDGMAGGITGLIDFDNIDAINGSGADDSLTGFNTTATWALDGGTENYLDTVSTQDIDFNSDFTTLTGGAGDDTFNITSSHTLDLNGGAGDDEFNLSVDGTIVTGNLVGGDDDDTFSFSNEARVSGNVNGGTDTTPATANDVINFSASTLTLELTISGSGSNHGQAGTILEDGAPNFDLITGSFDNIDSLVGNGGLIVGPNAATFWDITGLDSGTFGGSLATIGTTTFNSFEIRGNVDNDTFIFQNNATARISGSIDGGGGAGIDVLVGSLGADTFDITAGGTNVTLTHDGGAASTNLISIENIDNSVIADTANDIFNIDNNWTGSLDGSGGADQFIFANGVTVGGSITGGAGTDVIDWNAYATARNVTLTASAADGFSGTEASITGGFVTIDVLTGGTVSDTLTGRDVASTWTLDGTPQYTDGTATLDFSAFEVLQGGTNTDAFNVTAASAFTLLGGNGVDTFDIDATLTGSLDGQVGADILQGDLIDDVLLTGSDADGFTGTEADITLGFDGIDTITGNGGTLTGQDVASTWSLDAAPDYNNGTHTLNFTGFANLQGGTNTDAFNVTNANTFNLLGGTGIDTFDIDATLTGSLDGEGGADILQGDLIDAVVLTGSDADGFAGTEANITTGFDGISIITGNGGTLTGQDVASTWSLDAAPDYNNGTHTLNFTDFANLQGGTNTDAFNVTNANTFNLLGGTGIDTFDVDATLTGSLDGEGGADILQGDLIDAVVLTGSDADGFAGTEADITGGFDGIGTITGNAGTLTGQNVASTWALGGTPTYNNGTHTLNFTGFANLQGGTDTDAFNITAASAFNLLGGTGDDTFDVDATLTGSIDGEGGVDILQGDQIDAVVLTGSDADGFAGTEANITGGFDGIGTITGNGGTLTGRNAPSTWNLDGTPTYSDGNILNFTGFANLQGSTDTDAFNITAASAFNLLGGDGVDTFDVDATLTGSIDGEAGADSFTFDADVTGTVTGNSGDDVFNYNAGTIGTLTGGADDDEIIGPNAVTIWVLDGPQSGSVAGQSFISMELITGNAAQDTFNMTGGGNYTTVSGGDNADQFNVTGTTTADLLGGAGDDVFDIDAALDGSVAGEGGSDTLQGNLITDVTLTASTTDGYSGNVTVDATALNGTPDFTGINELTGTGAGTLTGDDAVSTWTLAATTTYDDSGAGGALTFDGFATLQGGNQADTFNVTAASVLNLLGGAGNDVFNLDADATGNVDGGANNDTFNLNTAGLTIGNIIGGAGTDEIIATSNAVTTFTLTANGVGTVDDGVSKDFTTVENLTGGTAGDTFNVNANHSGELTGNAGNDQFNFTATLTGDALGGAGDDTFDRNGAGSVNGLIDGGANNDTYDVSGATGTVTLTLGSGFADIQSLLGSNDTLIGRRNATNEWDLTGADSGAIETTADGTVNFDGFNTVRSGSGGDNTFTANGSYNGTVNLLGLNNRWNHTAGATLTTGAVTGTGSLTIPGTAGADMTIGAGDLVLPNIVGLTGPVFIGGTVSAATTPLNGSQTVDVFTNILTVASTITTGGDLVLLGSQIDLNTATMNVADEVNMIAVGTGCDVCQPGFTGSGNVEVNTPITVNANSGTIIAAGGIQNSNDLTLEFGGGDFQLAVSPEQQGTSNPNPNSNASGVELTPNIQDFINNVLGLNVVATVVTFFNPALQLFALDDVSFVDAGLFAEDLTLFGVIGEGIALSLAQCEEVEGCAPNVTTEELEILIQGLEARIEELERKIEETADPAEREELESLLAGFREELENYKAYREELRQFLEGPIEGDDLGDGLDDELDFGDEDFDEIPSAPRAPRAAPEDLGSVDTLAKMLSVINDRIDFLESLKTDTERRAELSERTGIELTPESLDRIIENTRKQVEFIESLIESLMEGSQTQSSDVFSADAGSPQSALPSIGYNSVDLMLRNGGLPMDTRWF